MMKEITDFLAKSPAFHIATVDQNNRPKVRPFSFVMEWNGKLTFTTNTTKNIYKQLTANPFIEVSSFDHNAGEWMRIRGEVKFTTDIEAKRKIFEVMPPLAQMYPLKENDPIIVCFYIENGMADLFSFTSMNNPIRSIQL